MDLSIRTARGSNSEIGCGTRKLPAAHMADLPLRPSGANKRVDPIPTAGGMATVRIRKSKANTRLADIIYATTTDTCS
eukprot:scaffold73305_cov29-Tisochrysis_lutea.AAC.3